MRRAWPHRGERRVLPWGLGAAAVYLAVAAVSLRGGWIPGRVLYDGLAPPPPYRWVYPPPELAKDNQVPDLGTRTIPVTSTGSPPTSVSTGDGQAGVDFPEGGIASARGAAAVEVRIVPLDPDTVGGAPPGLRFDSNAYRVEVRYTGSGAPAKLRAPASIVLRYATGATGMVRAEGSAWIPLPTTRYGGFLQLVVANTQQVGIFAAVAPRSLPYVERATRWLYLRILGAALIVGLAIRFLPQILATFRPAR